MFHRNNGILPAINKVANRMFDLITSKWVRVAGDSMRPTLTDGERVRVSRRAYWIADPQRWDAILFEHPNQSGFMAVKRIVGMPGEYVCIVDGKLSINGDELQDEFGLVFRLGTNQTWQVKSDEFIVLGDNRYHSTDSRSFGPVPRRNIIGKVILSKSLGSTR